MKQRGFKAFNKNMENQYGIKFEEGKIYTIPEHIILTKGTQGTGFHYTPNLEDTLRYVDGMIEEIKIASVTASKEIISSMMNIMVILISVPQERYQSIIYYQEKKL